MRVGVGYVDGKHIAFDDRTKNALNFTMGRWGGT